MTYYVFSTLSNDNRYCEFKELTGGAPHSVIERSVLILGGHGVAQKSGEIGIYTPNGVMTEVSDEDFGLLENNFHFKEHLKNGFITVTKKKIEPSAMAKDMARADESAPLTPNDCERKTKTSEESYKLDERKIKAKNKGV